MSDLLIQSVPDKDLEQIKAEAEARQQSLEAYMLELIREKAAAVRRRKTLSDITERLRKEGAEPISMEQILAAKNTLDHEAA